MCSKDKTAFVIFGKIYAVMDVQLSTDIRHSVVTVGYWLRTGRFGIIFALGAKAFL